MIRAQSVGGRTTKGKPGMPRCHGFFGLLFALFVSVGAKATLGAVTLSWSPAEQNAEIGQTVHVVIVAATDSAQTQAISSIDVVFSWDAARLELIGALEPCPQEPCPSGTYDWAQFTFPADGNLDALNTSWGDGNAYFQAIARTGSVNAAYAPASGLSVARLLFRAKSGGEALVQLHPSLGSHTQTRVLSAQFLGLDITGQLGPSAVVNITQCSKPNFDAIGARYLRIIPFPSAIPVALQVFGDPTDPEVACLGAFVQPDGTLGPIPSYLPPELWGTVWVSGLDIRPATKYYVRTDCRLQSPDLFSDAAVDTTRLWGDVTGNELLGINDVTLEIEVSNGHLPAGSNIETFDLVPCFPDGVVDQQDVNAVLSALQGSAFDCPNACTGPDLGDLNDFTDCMTGPFGALAVLCIPFDLDHDDDCDLHDAALLQRTFSGIGH